MPQAIRPVRQWYLIYQQIPKVASPNTVMHARYYSMVFVVASQRYEILVPLRSLGLAMKRLDMRWIGTSVIISAVVMAGMPAIAETCTPLQVVGGKGATQITKKISPPGTLVTSNNWNTDFVVPGRQSFERFVARVTPRNTSNYAIQLNLKYNNDSVDKVFDNKVSLKAFQTQVMRAYPRQGAEPYQINLVVGQAIGDTYTARVFGCNP